MATHRMKIAGLERELPLCHVSDELDIAAFIMFSDVEITVACAAQLLEKVPEFDIIMTAESKGIPLAYEMSRQCGKTDPIGVSVKSITTENEQKLFLSADDAADIAGKRVLIVDDVISTGESLKALEELVNAAGGNIVCKAAVLAEGEASDRDDILFLEKLPVFPRK